MCQLEPMLVQDAIRIYNQPRTIIAVNADFQVVENSLATRSMLTTRSMACSSTTAELMKGQRSDRGRKGNTY